MLCGGGQVQKGRLHRPGPSVNPHDLPRFSQEVPASPIREATQGDPNRRDPNPAPGHVKNNRIGGALCPVRGALPVAVEIDWARIAMRGHSVGKARKIIVAPPCYSLFDVRSYVGTRLAVRGDEPSRWATAYCSSRTEAEPTRAILPHRRRCRRLTVCTASPPFFTLDRIQYHETPLAPPAAGCLARGTRS
jgi:hypothetical protein